MYPERAQNEFGRIFEGIVFKPLRNPNPFETHTAGLYGRGGIEREICTMSYKIINGTPVINPGRSLIKEGNSHYLIGQFLGFRDNPSLKASNYFYPDIKAPVALSGDELFAPVVKIKNMHPLMEKTVKNEEEEISRALKEIEIRAGRFTRLIRKEENQIKGALFLEVETDRRPYFHAFYLKPPRLITYRLWRCDIETIPIILRRSL